MEFDWTQGALAEGLKHYQTGEFFAAHESWEILWLVAPEPEKMFLQALIQVTAAFHHLQRDNALGAARLFERALVRLERQWCAAPTHSAHQIRGTICYIAP